METLLGGSGPSITTCLLDPPRIIDKVALGVSSVGISMIEIDGVTHVLDWVGSSHYPNVADFAEEMFEMGVSRRISKAEDFSRLTAESRLMLIHARAHVEFEAREDDPIWDCPVRPKVHPDRTPDCIGKVWWDVEGLERDGMEFPNHTEGTRTIGSTSYRGRCFGDHIKRTYTPAIFAVVPIHRIAVIKHPHDDGVHESTLDLARQAGVPVSLEDE